MTSEREEQMKHWLHELDMNAKGGDCIFQSNGLKGVSIGDFLKLESRIERRYASYIIGCVERKNNE